MAGLFDTFSIAKRGLQVNQSLINTTSHNIANADTDGYSRQRSVVATTTPSGGNSKFDTCTVGQVGTGSQIIAIQRIRDTFIDARVRNQMSENGSLDAQDTYMGQVENIVNETSDTGVQKALSDFYTSFSSLTQGSANTSNKTVAIGKATTLASKISNRYDSLETIKTGIQSQLKSDVTSVNQTLDDINTLNDQIKKISTLGLTPNDLMDKRDNLLDTLSTELGITVTSGKDNSVSVTANENGGGALGSSDTLVNATDSTTSITSKRFSYYDSSTYDGTSTLTVKYYKLGDSSNPTTISVTGVNSQAEADLLKADLEKNRILVTNNNGDFTTPASSTILEGDFKKAIYSNTEKGKIGGLQTIQGNVQTSIDDLNTVAKSLAYTVNAIQVGGTTAAQVTASGLASSELIFVKNGTTSDDDISAANITVNSALDYSKLNCGKNSSSGDGDGTRASAISNISSLKIDYTKSGVASATSRADFFTAAVISPTTTDYSSLTSSTTGSTITNYYISALNKLDTKGSAISNDLSAAEISLKDIENQRTSASGVSTDEETTNLIEYNHAYQANAKVISTINDLLNVVINGLGV